MKEIQTLIKQISKDETDPIRLVIHTCIHTYIHTYILSHSLSYSLTLTPITLTPITSLTLTHSRILSLNHTLSSLSHTTRGMGMYVCMLYVCCMYVLQRVSCDV